MKAQQEVQGILIPIGGNEDKGVHEEAETYSLDFVEEGILSHVLKESGGENAKVLVIPTASSIPVEVGNNYIRAFEKLGCTDVSIADIRERAQSEDSAYLKMVQEADCVMFSGGDQSKIVDHIGGTSFHQILKERYITDPLVIAGTSAGAMCMSSEMIAGGSSTEALFKGAVLMRDGMSFVSQLIIDSHFIKRGRFGRLAEAVAKFPHLIGLGLAEDTGLIIKSNAEFKVIGSGMVILFDPSQLTHNPEDILQEGTPMSMSNLIVHILANGDRFLFENRQLAILPLEAEFE